MDPEVCLDDVDQLPSNQSQQDKAAASTQHQESPPKYDEYGEEDEDLFVDNDDGEDDDGDDDGWGEAIEADPYETAPVKAQKKEEPQQKEAIEEALKWQCNICGKDDNIAIMCNSFNLWGERCSGIAPQLRNQNNNNKKDKMKSDHNVTTSNMAQDDNDNNVNDGNNTEFRPMINTMTTSNSMIISITDINKNRKTGNLTGVYQPNDMSKPSPLQQFVSKSAKSSNKMPSSYYNKFLCDYCTENRASMCCPGCGQAYYCSNECKENHLQFGHRSSCDGINKDHVESQRIASTPRKKISDYFCDNCYKEVATIACRGCRKNYYCSDQCKLTHWNRFHRLSCDWVKANRLNFEQRQIEFGSRCNFIEQLTDEQLATLLKKAKHNLYDKAFDILAEPLNTQRLRSSSHPRSLYVPSNVNYNQNSQTGDFGNFHGGLGPQNTSSAFPALPSSSTSHRMSPQSSSTLSQQRKPTEIMEMDEDEDDDDDDDDDEKKQNKNETVDDKQKVIRDRSSEEHEQSSSESERIPRKHRPKRSSSSNKKKKQTGLNQEDQEWLDIYINNDDDFDPNSKRKSNKRKNKPHSNKPGRKKRKKQNETMSRRRNIQNVTRIRSKSVPSSGDSNWEKMLKLAVAETVADKE